MHNFKPETAGDLAESSDDVEALNTDDPHMESLDDDSDSSDDDSDEDIADIGEEVGASGSKENPFFQGSDDSDLEDSDDSFDDSETEEEETKPKVEIDEEDDLIKALKEARQKKERNCPPDIKSSDLLTDLSFHPESDLIAVGSIAGDLSVFKFANEENTLTKKLKLSKKTLRGLEFNEDGSALLTISKDRTFRILDTETWNIRYNIHFNFALLFMMTCEYLLLEKHEIKQSTLKLTFLVDYNS